LPGVARTDVGTRRGRSGRWPRWPAAAITPSAGSRTRPPCRPLTGSAIIPVLGIIFGHVSRGQARRKGLEPSGVATAGCVLGYVFTAIAVIAIIAIAVAAAHAGSAPCDASNPNWPYC
jgi:Domain of unknown function (DUF4190)